MTVDIIDHFRKKCFYTFHGHYNIARITGKHNSATFFVDTFNLPLLALKFNLITDLERQFSFFRNLRLIHIDNIHTHSGHEIRCLDTLIGVKLFNRFCLNYRGNFIIGERYKVIVFKYRQSIFIHFGKRIVMLITDNRAVILKGKPELLQISIDLNRKIVFLVHSVGKGKP